MSQIEDPYERSLKHVLTQILPKVKEKFQAENGKKVKSIQFLHNPDKKGEEQFQSVAIFGTIDTEYENGENSSIHVIIKMQIGDESNLQFNNGGLQFLNEIKFYDDFLPYFSTAVKSARDIFPKFVYGLESETGNRLEDIVILEDLSKEGYRLATSKTKLSLEHILLALKSLGKFHAASYIMKSTDKETFLKKVGTLNNVRNWASDADDPHQNFLAKNGERGLKYLENIPQYADKLAHVRNFLTDYSQSIPRLFEINKNSVLCHGDFCRNNMFFKYDQKSPETPTSVKLFDVATVVYASPVIDICFFLFMNTVQEQRVQHWNTMIQSYYDSLKETCELYSNVSKATVVIPTYEDLLEEFKVKAMMGYLSCSHFLPVMMQTIPEDRSLWSTLNAEEIIQYRLNTAGNEGTKAVGEILMHIIDSGFM